MKAINYDGLEQGVMDTTIYLLYLTDQNMT